MTDLALELSGVGKKCRFFTLDNIDLQLLNLSCSTPKRASCPETAGPDYDFGQPPILVSGGSIETAGPAVVNGMVFVNSGYGAMGRHAGQRIPGVLCQRTIELLRK